MGDERSQPLKVLYVAGSGRSGTTILANLLGQADGFVSVGELYMMWESALSRPNACGCRNYIPDCSFWIEVFEQAYGGLSEIEPARMDAALRAYFRTRHYALPQSRLAATNESANKVLLLRNLARLYRSIANVSGASVIVDASKRPVYGKLLAQLPGVELYVVHMVRDPRAVAYSWGRKQIKPVTGQPTRRMGSIKSTMQWWGLNVVAERALSGLGAGKRYLQLKYEDFAERPRDAYRSMLNLLGERPENDPFVSERIVRMVISHTMAGNRSRFANGAVEISLDRDWETSMTIGRKLLVTALTWPLLPRYGYPILHSRNA